MDFYAIDAGGWQRAKQKKSHTESLLRFISRTKNWISIYENAASAATDVERLSHALQLNHLNATIRNKKLIKTD